MPSKCLLTVRDIWTTVLPLTALLSLDHFERRCCSESEWQHLNALGVVCGQRAGTPVQWRVSCVCVVPCYSVELHTWESWESRQGNGEHPWVLSLVICSVSEESVFLLFWLFYQVGYEGIMFRFSLPPFPEERREGADSNLPYCCYLFWKVICTPLLLVSHALGWCQWGKPVSGHSGCWWLTCWTLFCGCRVSFKDVPSGTPILR